MRPGRLFPVAFGDFDRGVIVLPVTGFVTRSF